MTKTEQALEKIIEEFVKRGFIENGKTQQETVRVPTTKSPLFGRSGGELATFGGRIRLVKPETNIYATLGKRTVYIYEKENSEVKGIATLNTGELVEVKKVLKSLDK